MSSPRLPVFGNVARIAWWEGNALGGSMKLQRFFMEG